MIWLKKSTDKGKSPCIIENLYSPHNSDSSSDKIDTKYTTKIIKINLIRT